jgi:hypothetical protein
VGILLGPDGPNEGDYQLGDAIRWKECSDKSIPAWSYFEQNGRRAGGNVGDPAYRDIIIRATHYGFRYNWRSEPGRRHCPHCHELLEGIAVEIRSGALSCVWIYSPGEFTGNADYFVINLNGQLRPLPEWDDRPMPILTDCCSLVDSDAVELLYFM